MPLESIPSLMAFLLTLGLSLFVLSRAPRRLVNLSFAFGGVALALSECMRFLSALEPEGPLLILWDRLAFGVWVLSLGGWLLFSIIFARADGRERLRRYGPFIGIAGLVAFGLFFAIAFRYWPGLRTPFHGTIPFPVLRKIVSGVCILLLLAVLVNLEKTLRSSRDAKRWKIKHLILGLGLFLGYALFHEGQLILRPSVGWRFIAVRSSVLFVSMALVTSGVLRHRLLEATIFVSRKAVIGSVTLLATALYLFLAGIFGYAAQQFGGEWGGPIGLFLVFLAIAAFLVVTFSTRVRERVKRWIAAHFYENKYNYRREWLKACERLQANHDLEALPDTVIDLVCETLWAEKVSLWLREGNGEPFRAAAWREIQGLEDETIENGGLSTLLLARKEPFFAREAPGDLGDLCKQTDARLLSPLVAGDELLGFLTVSENCFGIPYEQDDLDLLKSLSTQISGVLLGARLSSELLQSRQLETLHRLSSFLLHDLKNLTSSLSLLVENAAENMDDPEFRQDAITTLSEGVNRLKLIIGRLMELPGELALEVEEGDLNALAQKAIRPYDGRNGAKIVMDFADLPPIPMDAEKIERVVENLVANAVDALSNGGEIRVRTGTDKEWVFLAVEDTGCGMTEAFIRRKLFRPFQSSKKGGLGIGLFQCKTVVEAHGGKIEVESTPGKGSRFRVLLPGGAMGNKTP
jgi:putative PEP-CTERM system histidine kinase